MTEEHNQRLGTFVETSAGGERVRAYVPAPLPPTPPLDLPQLMSVYERAIAAVGRLDGVMNRSGFSGGSKSRKDWSHGKGQQSEPLFT